MKETDVSSSKNDCSLANSIRVWWKIGVLSFGGPAAQIALMNKEIVEQRGWLTERQFLNGLSFCMLLPGPEAMQLATYIGWRFNGTIGGLIAGLLFVLPGAVVIMSLAIIYSFFGDLPLVEAFFYGIKPAVLVIVFSALVNISKKAINTKLAGTIALFAFICIAFLDIAYPIIILIAAACGWFINKTEQNQETETIDGNHLPIKSTFITVILWLAIWLLPLFLLVALGAPELIVAVGKFFSTMAVVTFGGAYAVLSYMAQDVVGHYGWLSAREMVDALGLAETTPGPLILVTQFVGFLAGFKEGGILLGLSAALVSLWVTFVPCFLWIFAGAPYIEWISTQPRLKGALAAITAAVVGVIFNLSIWFALHVLFAKVTVERVWWFKFALPDIYSVEWLAVFLLVASSLMSFYFRWGLFRILLFTSSLGAALRLIF